LTEGAYVADVFENVAAAAADAVYALEKTEETYEEIQDEINKYSFLSARAP